MSVVAGRSVGFPGMLPGVPVGDPVVAVPWVGVPVAAGRPVGLPVEVVAVGVCGASVGLPVSLPKPVVTKVGIPVGADAVPATML